MVGELHIINAPPLSIDTQSLAQPQKADEFCPSICHASTLSRLGQSQISCWIVQDLLNIFVTCQPKNLCMITKLQYTCLNGQWRYACSKLAQQRLMRQGGPRVTHYECPATLLSTLSHRHSHKKQMNLVRIFACLHSFQARPEPDHESFKILLNSSVQCQEAEESLHDCQVAVHVPQWPV